MRLAVLLAPLALLLAALPATHAADPLCDPACSVDQNGLAYVPPVLLVRSGGEVTFAALDTSHVTVEGTGVGGGGLPCFFIPNSPGQPAPAVRFTVAGEGLYAETLDGDGGPPVRCAGATGPGGAAFVLPYHCLLHPTMRGALVVAVG